MLTASWPSATTLIAKSLSVTIREVACRADSYRPVRSPHLRASSLWRCEPLFCRPDFYDDGADPCSPISRCIVRARSAWKLIKRATPVQVVQTAGRQSLNERVVAVQLAFTSLCAVRRQAQVPMPLDRAVHALHHRWFERSLRTRPPLRKRAAEC